jgi:hypothetical protein
MTPKFAARADANQPELVAAWREMGYLVFHTHTLGRGFPDVLVCGWHWELDHWALLWVEIKSEGGRLTPREREFFASLPEGAPVTVARDVWDVPAWFGVKP